MGRVMQAGDTVALVGPLGSGKTTFSQGLAEGLGVPPDRHVASPTFALINEHPGQIPFVHADFYRVEHSDELRELGLEEAYDHAAVAIEWADRYPAALPPDHLRIEIESEVAGARLLTLAPTGPRAHALAAAMASVSSP